MVRSMGGGAAYIEDSMGMEVVRLARVCVLAVVLAGRDSSLGPMAQEAPLLPAQ